MMMRFLKMPNNFNGNFGIPPQNKPCKHCGKTFTPDKMHRVYCGCKISKPRNRNRVCLVCGKKINGCIKNNKPFCGEICEIQYTISYYQQRNKKIGCAIID